jgi:hypothetical protein
MTTQQPNQHLPPLQPPQKPIPPSQEERDRDEYKAHLMNARQIAKSLMDMIGRFPSSKERTSAHGDAESALGYIEKLSDDLDKEDEDKAMRKHHQAQVDYAKMQAESTKEVEKFEARMRQIAEQAIKDARRDQT